MKSFRLYLKNRQVLPIQVVSDYRPDELMRFREFFRPIARRHRFWMRIGYIVITIAFVCILFSMFVTWFVFGFMICWLTLMLIKFLSPLPACPACHNSLDQGLGAYCPECGTLSLQSGAWFRAMWCSSCERDLWRGKSRHYTIRACTHCGVFLDEEGL